MRRTAPIERNLDRDDPATEGKGPEMTHMSTPDTSGAREPAPRQNVQPTAMTGWVGMVAFAGVMMVLLGAFHIIQGLVAVFQDEYFLISSSGLVLDVDYTVWGWTHIIGGAVLVGAGFFVFTGNVVARTIGVIVAMVSAIINIAFLSAYPIWSAIMIAIDVLVIWALTAHGGELRD
jgi:hypothetical protein